jgi:hypothetical protein
MNSAMTTKRAFQMLENETLWGLTERTHGLMKRQGIDHAIVGGVAVCLHGYRRNTVDLNLLVRPEDTAVMRPALEADGLRWVAADNEFRSMSGVPVLS